MLLTIDDIVRYISALSDIANCDHFANNGYETEDKTKKIRAGKENHVTRLVTNEFCFYGVAPLSTQEFSQLVRKIESIAKSLLPNVILLLSSFAVISEDDDLLNISILVQGGFIPSIDCFVKNIASDIDISFSSKYSLFDQHGTQVQKDLVHFDAIVSEKQVISTRSVFDIKTIGGACFTFAIDVCLEHLMAKSKQLMGRLIFTEEDRMQYLPLQIEHCVTSAAVKIKQDALLNGFVLHVDTMRSMFRNTDVTPGLLVKGRNPNYTIKATKSKKKTNLSDGCYRLTIGKLVRDVKIEILAERPAKRHLENMAYGLNRHNSAVFDFRLRVLGFSADSLVISGEQVSLDSSLESMGDLTELLSKEDSYLLERIAEGWLTHRFIEPNKFAKIINHPDLLKPQNIALLSLITSEEMIKRFIMQATPKQIKLFAIRANEKQVTIFANTGSEKQIKLFSMEALPAQIKAFAKVAGAEQVKTFLQQANIEALQYFVEGAGLAQIAHFMNCAKKLELFYFLRFSSLQQMIVFSEEANEQQIMLFTELANEAQIKIFAKHAGMMQIEYFSRHASYEQVNMFVHNSGIYSKYHFITQPGEKQFKFFLKFLTLTECQDLIYSGGQSFMRLLARFASVEVIKYFMQTNPPNWLDVVAKYAGNEQLKAALLYANEAQLPELLSKLATQQIKILAQTGNEHVIGLFSQMADRKQLQCFIQEAHSTKVGYLLKQAGATPFALLARHPRESQNRYKQVLGMYGSFYTPNCEFKTSKKIAHKLPMRY